MPGDSRIDEKLRRVAHEVKASIDEGQKIFAREPALDEPLRVVFPELRDLLVIGERGTLAYANDIGAELTATRQSIAAERAALRAQQAEEAAVASAAALEAALTPARPRQWTLGGGVPFDKWSLYAKACELAGYEFTLIRQAYEAREARQSVVEFARSKGITTDAGVRSCLSVLNRFTCCLDDARHLQAECAVEVSRACGSLERPGQLGRCRDAAARFVDGRRKLGADPDLVRQVGAMAIWRTVHQATMLSESFRFRACWHSLGFGAVGSGR